MWTTAGDSETGIGDFDRVHGTVLSHTPIGMELGVAQVHQEDQDAGLQGQAGFWCATGDYIAEEWTGTAEDNPGGDELVEGLCHGSHWTVPEEWR